MSNSTNGMSLSKTENKLLLPLIMYGSKTKRELSLATDLQAEKIDEALSALINKGLIQYDEENKVYFSVLPVKRIIDLLDQSASEIESKRKNQSEKFQQFNKIIEENLEQFRISFETQLNEFKTASNQRQVSLEEEFDTSEERQIKNATELAETLLSSFQTSVVESQTNFQTFLSSESTRFEKEIIKTVDDIKTIPESGTRTFKKSVDNYEQELSSVIKSVTEKTESVQTQLSEVLAEIGTVSASQLQQFYTNVESIAEEFKTNLSTGLNESWKHEKEFVNEIRNHVQSTLEDKIVKALQNVVKNLSKELDEGINDALNNVKLQTNSAIKESSNQIKEEFKEFVENATELIQEQRTSLNVLNTEISEISSEKKLSGQRDHFLNQLNAHLSADLSVLETNYRKAQNTATDILENIRQSAKKRMIQQSNAFEELLLTFISEIEKSISRKNKDIENLQRISQSSTQFLNNLMVSIPMKTNQYKTSLKDSIDNTISELQEAINETPLNPVNEIYNLLNSSQKRVEAEFKETFEENQREIQNVINASEQLNNTVSNLQETYLEKIEHRFEQRAKVMNTELEAFTRNFQQVLNGIESGFGDINERLQLNIGSVDNIEISLENSVSQLKNEVDHVFTQNKTNTSEFISELDNNLQNHIDRILDVIREGFGQIKTEFNTEIEKQLEQLNSNSEVQQSSLLTTIDSFFNHSHGYITDFRSSILRAFEENQNELVDSINENRKGTDEVISKYQESIAKYQEKGPLDILSFINQIESEVSNQNKNVKDSMDELASYYNGLSEVSMNEVSGLVRQVNESGDKLSAVVNDYLQIVSNSLTKTADKIDLYYTDTTTEVENQVNVTSGFISSDVEVLAKNVEEEVQVLKTELKETGEKLNSDIKDLITRQDQEFRGKIPDMSQEFSQIFDDIIQDRSSSNEALKKKAENDLATLLDSWNKRMENTKVTLEDVSNAINKAIEANLENLEVIVQTNVEETLARVDTILNIESSKEDIFGLQDIQTKVKQANKRLKATITESIKSYIEQFDQRLPELVTAYEAVHTQTKEDLSAYLEDFGDLISSSQSSLTSQLYRYLKEEEESLIFSETEEELNTILHNLSNTSTSDVESFTTDLTDNIKKSVEEVNKSREEIKKLLTKLSDAFSVQNTEFLSRITNFKEELWETIENIGQSPRKSLNKNLESYNNDLEKNSLEFNGKTMLLVQTLNQDFEKHGVEVLNSITDLLGDLTSTQNQNSENLRLLSAELSRVKPITDVRLLNISTNEAKTQLIKDMIDSASQQVTLFISNPTILSSSDLRAIPPGKRVYIITNFDFSKKGKKWASEIGKSINLSFHKAKTTKLSGILAVQDDKSSLILPEILGFTTTDAKITSYFASILSLLKGKRFQLQTK
ncbi:MAG: apolipoprotein A-IV repeat region-like domain-containing protein [Candidatus Hodarchaeales archaeon]|jgi:hypothetical protein